MGTPRNFSNTASGASLNGTLAAGATTALLTNFSNFPPAPFTATISRNNADEEIVLVTAVTGSTVTLTRGFDSTSAQAHAAGATFEHTAVATDFREAQAHLNATTGHGTTSALVGVDDVQTLTGKTVKVLKALASSAGAGIEVDNESGAQGKLFRGLNAGVEKFFVDYLGNLTGGSFTGTAGTFSGALSAAGTAAVAGVLSANGGLTVPTGKKATLIDAPAAGTDGVNKVYADARETAAKSYTDTRETAIKSYADGLDATRKTYIDDRTTTTGASRIAHVDWGDVTVFPAGAKRGDTCRRSDLASLWQYDGGNWVPVTPVFGKLWRTAGASGVLVQNTTTAVTFQVSRVAGGFATAPDQLVIPVDGLYDLAAGVYWTGTAAFYATTFVNRIRASVADLAIVAGDLHLHAPPLDGRSHLGGKVVPLKAGDKLSLTVYNYTGGSADAHYFGSSEATGCYLSAQFSGPLNGATPL